jgi:hypothetical protein
VLGLIGLAGWLGYRRRRQWRRFRRTGIVTAERRAESWSWTTASGETMTADAGDWAVSDDDGSSWSVRDDIFRNTYAKVDANRWQRTGLVTARRANTGEIVRTLEGPVAATSGSWVVRGEQGEQWVVPAEKFASNYVRAGSLD